MWTKDKSKVKTEAELQNLLLNQIKSIQINSACKMYKYKSNMMITYEVILITC